MLDPEDLREMLAQQDHRGPQDRQVRRVTPEPPAFRDRLAPLVQRVTWEQRVRLVPQVRRVR